MAFAAAKRLATNPALRMLMTAATGFYVGSFAHSVLLVVYAFSVGGTAAAGVAMVARMLPGGLLSPLAASLATRRRPSMQLAVGIGGRSVATAATVVAVLDAAPLAIVFALAVVDSMVSSTVRPLIGTLVVRLAATAAEAAAGNAATSFIWSASALAGPAFAGLALGFVGVGWAFCVPTAAFATGTFAALLIRPPGGDDQTHRARAQPLSGFLRSQLFVIGAGFRMITASRPATAATGLFVVNVALVGIWYVASAAVANDHLRLGERGVTTIMALYGTGGLLGALATLSIVGRPGLSAVLSGAMCGWAVTLTGIGAVDTPAPALALAAGAGAAGAVAYSIAPTLVQRSVASVAMVPATASLQSLYQLANAAGAAVAPLLIGWVGLPTTLAAAGSAAAITLVAWPQLRRAERLSDDDAAKLSIIRADSTLARLPALALERLARTAVRLSVPAGADVIREGDPGDRFYMIAAGVADVTVDHHRVATLGAGGSFGEIALLRDEPRSATVTAREDLDLVAVDRAEFLTALASDIAAMGRISGVIRARLDTAPVEERLIELDRDTALNGRSVTELLAAQPPFAAIGPDAVREIADSARVLAVPDGALIVREGDYGDTYYVILDGGGEVLEDQTTRTRMLGPGEGFGERAILRDVPRTATVRACGSTTLVAVDRAAFQHAKARGGF